MAVSKRIATALRLATLISDFQIGNVGFTGTIPPDVAKIVLDLHSGQCGRGQERLRRLKEKKRARSLQVGPQHIDQFLGGGRML
jgi:hypothetical protein